MDKKSEMVQIVKRLGAMAVILVIVSVLARATGAFSGFDEILGMVHISKETLFELLIAILFVCVVEQIILMLLTILKGKKARTKTMLNVFGSLVQYAAVLVGFCWSMTIIGVDVSTVFASVGIIALIIGFGAESLVADLVTGVFILFENQYNIGDIIEVDGFRGVVIQIGIRTMSLEDTGGNVKIINNSNLKNIINRSEQISVAVSDIDVSYDTDLEHIDKILEPMLEDIKERNSDVFKNGITFAGVEALGASGITLRFVAQVDEQSIFSSRRLLNKELKIAFDKEGIAIPFPQMDVHMK
ncbi:MAG: mechanosensitive ion channel [Lachnospiraceae bacterium]|nr:mechanosensitive ion channel [Lachnospiraceae bacterium]